MLINILKELLTLSLCFQFPAFLWKRPFLATLWKWFGNGIFWVRWWLKNSLETLWECFFQVIRDLLPEQ